MAQGDGVPFGHDFYIFRAMARAVLDGGSPYDRALLSREFAEIGFDPAGDPVLGNPPWSVWVLPPFSLGSFHAAMLVWYLAMFAAFAIFWRRSIPAYSSSSPVALLGFAPFFSNILWGQSNWIAALGLTARAGGSLAAGAIFSLAMSKPQLFVPLFTYTAISRARRREWTFLCGWALGFAAQAAVSFLLSPPAFAGFPDEAARGAALSLTFPAPTIAQITGSAAVRTGLVAAGILFGCLYGFGKMRRGGELFLLSAGFLTAPYCWSHSFVLLAPAYRMFAARNSAVIVTILGAAMYLLAVNPPWDRWFIFLPALLAIWSFAADPGMTGRSGAASSPGASP